ncbi:unnamed protein product, partial [Phaeothamnion confervicola]
EERLAGFVVERKTAKDLAASIMDGRYSEQKRRLQLSGIGRVVYLVEGRLCHQSILSPAALRSALASTEVACGFAVQRTANMTESVAFLRRVHHNIAAVLTDATDCSGSDGGLGGVGTGGAAGIGGGGNAIRMAVGGAVRLGMTYREYQERCCKNRDASARGIFGAQLRQLHNCSAGRVQAVLQRFPTPLSLMAGLAAAGSAADAERLLGSLRCTKGRVLPRPLIKLIVSIYGPEEDGGAA